MARRLAFVLALAVLAPALANARADPAEGQRASRDQRAAGEGLGRHRQLPGHELASGCGQDRRFGGNEQGATRTLTLQSGGKIHEKLNKYDKEGRSFSYEIEVDVMVLPVTNYSSTLSVKGAGDKSTVEWRGAFYRGFMNNDPPPELSDEAAIKAITGVYRGGLDALKKKLESGS